jgi:hypothetical protein
MNCFTPSYETTRRILHEHTQIYIYLYKEREREYVCIIVFEIIAQITIKAKALLSCRKSNVKQSIKISMDDGRIWKKIVVLEFLLVVID